MFHAIRLFVVLFAVWLALSGHYTVFLILSGAVCAALCVALVVRMDRIDRVAPMVRLTWRTPLYWAWLTKEVFVSSIDVTRRVLHPKMPIDPLLERVPATQHTDIGLVTYANSITLTPGTLSTDVEKGEIEVHALSRSLMEDLEKSEMGRRISDLEPLSRKADDA